MAFCNHCGAKIPDNHRFCTECGAAQPIGAPAKPPVSTNQPQPGAPRMAPNQPQPGAPRMAPNQPQPGAPRMAPNQPQVSTPPVQQPQAPAAPRNNVADQHTTYIPMRNSADQGHTTYIPKKEEPAAPRQSYGAPQQTYGAPQQTYGAPQQSYGAPQQSYGAPQQTYGVPQQSYGAPQQSYGAPQQSYGAPQQSYGAPQQSYGAPQQNYTVPQPSYTVPQPSAGSQPQPGITKGAGKPKKSGKKVGLIIAIILILALIAGAVLFFLNGGMDLFDSKKEQDVPEEILGVYNRVYEDEEDDNGEWLELKSKGKGKLYLDEETYSFTWELDGEDLTIIQQKDEYYGTLEEGTITLEINDESYTFLQEGYEPDEEEEDEDDETPPFTEAPAAEAPAATEAPAETAPSWNETDPSSLDYWEGDWYGWWIINTVYEGDTDYENLWWDCCANLSIDSDGDAVMTIWDEDFSRTDVLGEVQMEVSIVDGNVAEFTSLYGYFNGEEVGYGDWYCRSDDDEYDQTFWVSAEYDDGEGLCFDYTFYMRPWGVSWEDIARNDPGLLPRYYEDWYLPLIASGYDKAPDTIG